MGTKLDDHQTTLSDRLPKYPTGCHGDTAYMPPQTVLQALQESNLEQFRSKEAQPRQDAPFNHSNIR